MIFCSVGGFALQGYSGLCFLKGKRKCPVCYCSSGASSDQQLLYLSTLVNFLFTFGACYEILCKASVQYRAFPRDPRKPVLLSSVLVRLKAGTVELFYLWKSSPPFLHTAEATAASYLPCVMTAQLCSG